MKTTKVENAIKGLENAPKTYNELATELQTAPVVNVSAKEVVFTDRLAAAAEQAEREQSATASEKQAMTEIGSIMDKLNAVPWNKVPATVPWDAEEGRFVFEIQAVKPFHNRKNGTDALIVEFKVENEQEQQLYRHSMWLSMEEEEITSTLSTLLTMGYVQGSPTAFRDMEKNLIELDVRINATESRVYTNTYPRKVVAN